MNSEVTEKIRKVLDLAKRGGTEAEANTAMRMALQLLAKHNMSMSDIQDTEIHDEDITQDKTEIGAKHTWQRDIFTAIGRLYFCQPYYQDVSMNGKNYIRMVLTGKPSNIETAKNIANYLIQLGEELSRKPGEDRFYRYSFKAGYSNRIAIRAQEEKAAATTKIAENSTALMVINLYAVTAKENSDFLASKGIMLRSSVSRGRKIHDQEGAAAGRAAGNSVSLRSAPTSAKRLG